MARYFKHRPLLDSSAVPVRQCLRRLPLAIRDEVAAELRRWEEAGVIEKVDSSPWLSNMVVVCKKSGEIRLCVDLSAVNQAVIPRRHPLPTAEDITAEFHRSTVFSKLDLKQDYLQLRMAEGSPCITAFLTQVGVFQFRRMPFGLSSAPSAFQKMMTSVLAGIPGVAIYMDDIAVHGPDRKIHAERLDQVFQRLTCHQLTVNNEKCLIGVAETLFVGRY
ncbi:uncharacterized protein K02A2.6-like [Corticium candelabrum]|uniref:uncharacterized protein K02A2.6-like n=1 Tax=Corticium candelabrum TaxID=121492 RepID=UPI002E25BBB0|nr:uncharacterized protein K02A2.6-like [Corticium candelabrum]